MGAHCTKHQRMADTLALYLCANDSKRLTDETENKQTKIHHRVKMLIGKMVTCSDDSVFVSFCFYKKKEKEIVV